MRARRTSTMMVLAAVLLILIAIGAYVSGRQGNPERSIAVAAGGPQSKKDSGVGDALSRQAVTAEPLRGPPRDSPVFRWIGPKAYEIGGSREPRAPGDALEYMVALKKRSDAGDADASYLMELAVRDCRNLIKNDPVASFDFLRNAGMSPDPANLVDDERRLAECEGLVAAPSFYHGGWLARAASQGSIEAKLLFAIDPEAVVGPPTEWLVHPEALIAWKRDAMNHLHDAAGTGSIDAVSQLSRTYALGRVTPHDGVKAYAYALAAARASPAHTSQRDLQELESKLDPSQRKAARTLASEVYENCCTQGR